MSKSTTPVRRQRPRAPAKAVVEPEAAKPTTRKKFSSYEDEEILNGVDMYKNGWQQVLDDPRSVHLKASSRSARSIQARYQLLKKNLNGEEKREDVTPTPVDRQQVIGTLLPISEAKQIIKNRIHQQEKYVIDTEDVESGTEDDVKADLQDYFAAQRQDRLQEKERRGLKRKQREEAAKEKDQGLEKEKEKETEMEKEKEKEVGKEKEADRQNEPDSESMAAAVEDFRAHHKEFSSKKARTKKAERMQEDKDVMMAFLELQQKQFGEQQKIQQQQQKEQSDTLITLLKSQAERNEALVAQLLAMAERLTKDL